MMKLTLILRVTAQLIITEVESVSWGQLQNSQLNSPYRVSRYRSKNWYANSFAIYFQFLTKH